MDHPLRTPHSPSNQAVSWQRPKARDVMRIDRLRAKGKLAVEPLECAVLVYACTYTHGCLLV